MERGKSTQSRVAVGSPFLLFPDNDLQSFSHLNSLHIHSDISGASSLEVAIGLSSR